MRLAKEIVATYHGEEKAVKAEKYFADTFEKGVMPAEALEVKIPAGAFLSSILVESKTVSSKTEFRRLVEEGAITIADSGEKITDTFLKVEKNMDLRVGKKRFIKIKISP